MSELDANFEEPKRETPTEFTNHTPDYAMNLTPPFPQQELPDDLRHQLLSVDQHGIPQRFLNGDASLNEYLVYFKNIDPTTISIGNYRKITDLIANLAELLDIPE